MTLEEIRERKAELEVCFNIVTFLEDVTKHCGNNPYLTAKDQEDIADIIITATRKVCADLNTGAIFEFCMKMVGL